MPKKKIKQAAADESAPDATPDVSPPVVEQKSTVVAGIAADDLDVLRQPIDDRMAALLKDHQRMGARPK